VLRIWLREGGITLPEARVATAGWGGDRLVLLRGPSDALAVGLVTAWDSTADVAEFAAAARTTAAALGLDFELVEEAPQRVIIAFGDQASSLAEALGS
jgi:hypothetical protein